MPSTPPTAAEFAAQLTPAQRSNFWPLTAWGYSWWRARSLSLLSGQPCSPAQEERLFVNLCCPGKGQHWLDIGTSTGFYAGVLARRSCRVEALDLSPAMLREAKRQQPSPLISWHQLNAEATGWPSQSFDGVTIGATLNETAHPAQMLTEAARLLRPGGQLWLMYVPASGGAGQGAFARLSRLFFPDLSWVQAQLPGLVLQHALTAGQVQFALFNKPASAL